jgi:hypothetical protein
VSDDSNAGGPAQPPAPIPAGFDWLIEAHQETAASTPTPTPTPDAAEASAPPTLTFASVSPKTVSPKTVSPQTVSPETVPPETVPPETVPPATQPVAPPPVAAQPPQAASQPPVPPQAVASPPAPYQAASPVAPPPPSAPAASQFDALFTSPAEGTSAPPSSAGAGTRALALERHVHETRPTNSPLDWIALVLAIILPPIGLITAVVAAFLGTRNRGFATTVAKAAIGIGAGLTVVAIIGAVVEVNLANQQAKHDAIAASSAAFCAKVKANPATLQSQTFGWPPPGDTIPDTITSMQAYEANWAAIENVAPAGIRPGTQKVVAAAQSIISSVQSSQVFDDSNDISQMTQAASASGIQAWVTNYCS